MESQRPPGVQTRRLQAALHRRLFRTALPPVRIGRYIVDSRLGDGGMGIVYLCRDEDLGRHVAVKVIRPHLAGEADYTRIRREARALAAVSHPNVVEVFDVGLSGHQTFIAMEYVQGQTLQTWATPSRPWRETVDAYAQAGRGLAAAHALGLVHRDFKPSNAIAGVDGLVRVLDFGLARPLETARSATGRESADPAWYGSSTGSHAAGAVGTPAYMAPEQLEARATDARTDQFNFCVALHEGLYGFRPFPGNSPERLLGAILRQELEPPVAAHGVPASVYAALRTGLRAPPEDRHPSMEALLGALARANRPRRRWVAIPALAVPLLGVGLVASMPSAASTDACELAAAELDRAWTPTRRAAVRQVLADSDAVFAADTAERVDASLVAYAHRWRRTHEGVCAAGTRGQRQCMAQRRREFLALVDVLEQPDAQTRTHAATAVRSLPPLQSCSHPADAGDDATGASAPVLALQEEIARIEAVVNTGRHEDALALADAALPVAEALGHTPTLIRVRIERGRSLMLVHRDEEAEAELEAAFLSALQTGDDRLAGKAGALLSQAVGFRAGQQARALRWVRATQAALQRADAERTADAAALLNTTGVIARRGGDYERAEADLLASLALKREVLPPDDPRIAGSLDNLGLVARQRGRYDDAIAFHREALSIRERVLGGAHPELAGSVLNLGTAHRYTQDFEAAAASYERALSISESALGPTDPKVAYPLNNLAELHLVQGKPARSIEFLERALTIRLAALGPDHHLVASTTGNLASVYETLGEDDKAAAHYARALVGMQNQLGSDHPRVATMLDGYGLLQLRRGQTAEAIDLLSRALQIRSAEPGDAAQLRRARFSLGKALWTEDRARADTLITRALESAGAALREEIAAFRRAGA